MEKFQPTHVLSVIFLLACSCTTYPIARSLEKPGTLEGQIKMDGFTKISPIEQLKLDSDLLTARIVGLGETAHGSGQLHRLAGHIAESISKIASKPVLLLLEAPYSTLRAAARKLENGENISLSDLDETYGVWKTDGMVSALNEISALNRQNPGRVKLIGFDVRQPIDDFRTLSQHLKSSPDVERFTDLEYVKKIERGILAFRPNSEERASVFALKRNLKDASTISMDANTRQAFNRVNFWLDTYSQPDMKSVFRERDKAMFTIIQNLIAEDSQVIVWAHLGHLIYDSKNSQSKIDFLSEIDVLGTLLRKKFGAKYRLVAIAARELDCINAKGSKCKLTAKDGSIEATVGLKALYRISPETFSTAQPMILARTDGSLEDKEMYPEFALMKQQLDYLAIDR